jgi:FecR protein
MHKLVNSNQKIILFLVCMVLCSSLLMAQKGVLQFGAQRLLETSAKLTGDSACWPLVVMLAQHDNASNIFQLNASAQSKLQRFGIIHKQVILAKQNLSKQIKSGAKVFATEELDSATVLNKRYDTQIANGSLEDAQRTAQQFIQSVKRIEKLIADNRTEIINAKLAQKTNIVDKRRGLLGGWQTAYIGDLFAAYDGLRTGMASMAQLYFSDGVDVLVDPSTTIIIRSSQKDKLDQTVQRSIVLKDGGMLAQLSEKAKETNRFAFTAGSSESVVHSGKFWANTTHEQKAKLSNYDGTIDVTASNIKVTLKQNQGTVVEKGRAPITPVNLLSGPQLLWERTDTVVYFEKFMLHWSTIINALQYQVEVSPSKIFDHDIKRFVAKVPALQLTGLPLATVYVRIQALDSHGLRGVDSPVYSILRVKDTQPPAIYIDGWDLDRKYTMLDLIIIHGKTKPDAVITVDGMPHSIESDGTFVLRTAVTKPETRVNIAVTDQSGNKSTRILSIVPIDAEKVFRIVWNCRVNNDTLVAQGETIDAHGTAYPGIKVTAIYDGQQTNVRTSPQGDWAVSLKTVKGKPLQLIFDAVDDQKTIGTKSWFVK